MQQRIRFGQLIEYNVKNLFLEESYKQCDEENYCRPFSDISPDQQFEVLYSFLLLYVQVEDYQNALNIRCWPCFYLM